MSAVSETEIRSISPQNDDAAAVLRLATEPEAWPLDRYDEDYGIDWARIINMWIAVALGAVETVLSFRLGFRLAGANAENGFVSFIYDVTGPLVAPFQGIVVDSTLGAKGVFEGSTIVAMLAYLIGAMLLMAVTWAAITTAAETRESSYPRSRRHTAA